MKSLLISLFIIISYGTYSQAFYNTYKTEGFQDMMQKGIVYIYTGASNEELIVNALKKYWNACPYHIAEVNDGEKIYEDQFILAPGSETLIAKAKLLSNDEINKYSTIGYIMENGLGLGYFSQRGADLNIAFMNACIKQINEHQIGGRSGQVNDRLEKIFLESGNYDPSKTLLIVGFSKPYISTTRVAKLGIKYKTMSIEDFEEIDEEELKGYYLLYTDPRDFFTFSIFDLEKMELALTHRDSTTGMKTVNIGILKKWTK